MTQLTVQPISNPFAVEKPTHLNAGTVEVESSRAFAEVQAMVVVAKKFPREQAMAFTKAMESCSRPSLAEKATYAYPKGKDEHGRPQIVSGPSIRLAEELARLWGNLTCGILELSQREGISEMQAFCWDLQTNTRHVKNFAVKHERYTKKGSYPLTDPRDIYELTANQGGRRLRAVILAILPPDLVEAALEQCRRTLAGDARKPLADRVNDMVTAFEKVGVTADQLKERLGCPLDKCTPDQLSEFGSIFNSIKDGMTSAAEWFGGGATEEKRTETANALKAAAGTKGPSEAKPPVVNADPSEEEAALILAREQAEAEGQVT